MSTKQAPTLARAGARRDQAALASRRYIASGAPPERSPRPIAGDDPQRVLGKSLLTQEHPGPYSVLPPAT